ncbi:antibiotic biosynthesis monooxygenase [Actinomadura soli]|uniref:Antibiotic biosynthesis monooxygenase n=1 Tax=Actinomadura soli TaxID=2508997 RepID=A0A5C4J439_9ACTN|nr:antibiotic biosynthesis monooxygenase [Actinomadura soli]TMQ91580.1 antibiotic biosynthesis monooxygenase [Actinomadura soli]
MPTISADSGYLTVLNLFSTDAAEKQDQLLSAMREIVDTAAFEGWISSTVHSGRDRHGTANFIQWRSGEDLDRRYAEDKFKHRTVPLFEEMSTSMKLLRTVVASTHQHPSQGGTTEISPDRDDHTVIEFFGVAAEHQDDLVTALGQQEWLQATPGYRSHTVLRGLDALRGVDGPFVVTYSQWDGKESYDAFRALPEAEWPGERKRTRDALESLVTARDWNSYRVVHTRSASLATP